METPLNPAKAPRRKLKRVLKKKKVTSAFSHNSSTQQLYQKKVKSAINVSLNSSNNVRSLQANNRSLAKHVVKLNSELGFARDVHTSLLRRNHYLSERVLELERELDETPSIIEYEVESRYQAKLQEMKVQLSMLMDNASVFTKVLTELQQQCVSSPRKPWATPASHRLSLPRRSTRSNRSSQGAGTVDFSPYCSPASQKTLQSFIGKGRRANTRAQRSPEALDRGCAQEMSILMEASYLGDQLASALPLNQEVPESNLSLASKVTSRVTSRLPRRKPVARLEAGDSSEADVAETATELSFPVAKRRQSTRKCHAAESLSPSQTTEESAEENLDIGLGSPLSSGQQERVLVNTSDNDDGLDVADTDTTVFSQEENLDRELNKINEKSSKINSTKRKPNEVLKPDARSPPLYISNEFELMNAHKQRMERIEALLASSNTEPENPCEDVTTYNVQDMELTMGICDNNIQPIIPPLPCKDLQEALPSTQSYHMSPKNITSMEVNPSAGCSLPESEQPAKVRGHSLHESEQPVKVRGHSLQESEQPVKVRGHSLQESEQPVKVRGRPSRSRSRQRHGSTSTSEDTGSDPEKALRPAPVSMQYSKKGTLVFAAGRKGEDGSRPVVSAPVRARSKPKKTNKTDVSVLETEADEAKTIFDFHDKTPKALHQPENSMSVFSISADESALSPLGPLSKLRQASKKATSEDFVGAKAESVTEEASIKPLSPTEKWARSRERARSRGRSRKKFVGSVEDNKPAQKETQNEATEVDASRAKADLSSSSAAVPQAPGMDIASMFVGEVYSAPLKGSPEVKTRYRTRSQSRGRRGRSSSRTASPESAKKVRSKSTSAMSSPAQDISKKGDIKTKPRSPSVGKKGEKSERGIVVPNFESPLAGNKNESIALKSQIKNRKSCSNAVERNTHQSSNEEVETIPVISAEVDVQQESDIRNRSRSPIRISSENETSPAMVVKRKSCLKKSAKSSRENTSKEEMGATSHPSPQKNEEAEEDVTSLKQRLVRSRGKSADKKNVNLAKTDVVDLNKDAITTNTFDDESTSKREKAKAEELIVNSVSKSKRGGSAGRSLQSKKDSKSDAKAGKERCKGENNCQSYKEGPVVHQKVELSKGFVSPGRHDVHDNAVKEVDKDSLVCEDFVLASPAGKSSTSKQQISKVFKKQMLKKDMDGLDYLEEAMEPIPHPRHSRYPCKSPGRRRLIELGTSELPTPVGDEQKMKTTDQTLEEEESQSCSSSQKDAMPSHCLTTVRQDKVAGGQIEKSDSPTKGPRVSKIKKKNSGSMYNFKSDSDSFSSVLHCEGRKRRAVANVSYVAPALNCKLRRGDPFTSHYATEKISIYKSPKSKVKEKAERAKLRRDVLGTLHNLAIKEDPNNPEPELE